MESDLFYIKNIHKINNIKLKAFVLNLGNLKENELNYENCKLTHFINHKLNSSSEQSSMLFQLNYIHKQYHDDIEKIIKLKDNSHYIIEQISKL